MPQLILQSIENETSRIRVFHFVGADTEPLPAYEAGAHLDFDLGAHGSRSYSLIDWPAAKRERYSIAVQKEDAGAGGSLAMHQLSPGDRIDASEPKNDFQIRSSDGPVILLAGGIGITPLISMATMLTAQGRSVELHYTGRTRDAMGFATALQAAFGPAVHLYTDDEQPIDLERLLSNRAANTDLYVCGPQGMIENARSIAASVGLSNVYVELFSTRQPDVGDQSFEVEINDGRVFVVPPEQSIIDVLEAADVDIMYDCQRGDCGICQTDVLQGEPDHRDVVLSQSERASGSVMQICVSRSKSPRLVLDI